MALKFSAIRNAGSRTTQQLCMIACCTPPRYKKYRPTCDYGLQALIRKNGLRKVFNAVNSKEINFFQSPKRYCKNKNGTLNLAEE